MRPHTTDIAELPPDATYSDILKANTLSDGFVRVRYDKLLAHPKYRSVDEAHKKELVKSITVCYSIS